MDKEQKPKVWYKRRKTWIIAIIILVVVLVVRQITKPKTAFSETATVSRGTVKEELVLSGEIDATDNASLPFNISGNLSWVGVKVGDHVTRGQALIKLDTFKLNSTFQKAASAYRLTQASVDKVHDDLKNKGAAESFTEKETRTAAEVANDQAYEGYISAQKDLKDATLLAPFDGIVTSLTNEAPGVNIIAGTTQVKIVNPKTIYFSVNADQTDVSHLSASESASLTLDAFLDEPLTGSISNIAFTPSEADSGTVYPVRILLNIDNSSYKYRIGMTGDATFTISQKDNVLFVPNKFVKSDKNGKYVLTNQGKDKKYIKVGIEGDDRTEIMGDITEGTVVYN